MNKEELSWKWEVFRHKVALIEKNFAQENREKYEDYYKFEAALNRELKRNLKEEKEELLQAQLLLKVRTGNSG